MSLNVEAWFNSFYPKQGDIYRLVHTLQGRTITFLNPMQRYSTSLNVLHRYGNDKTKLSLGKKKKFGKISELLEKT